MALPSLSAQDLDNVYSATLAEMSSEVTGQLLTENPIIAELTKNVKTGGMGKWIEFRLRYGRNPNAKFFVSSSDTINLTSTQVLTTAYVEPSLLVIPVKFDDIERKQNSGAEQIVDLAGEYLEQAKETGQSILAENLYGDGASKTTMGLGAWVPQTVGSNTVAGISESSASWWQSYSRTSAGSWAANGYLGTSNDYMVNAYLRLSDGSKKPNLIISDDSTFEKFHRTLGQQVRYISQSAFGEIGKLELQFLGSKYLHDKNADADTTFMLHTDDFEWHVTEGMNFDTSDVRRVDKQPFVSYVVMALRHQLVCKRRNLQGRISGWTA